MKSKRIIFVVNVDWFFLSHRLPLALEALNRGYDVFLLAADCGKREEVEKYGIKFVHIPFERSGSNPIHELKCVFKLKRLYKKLCPDIIHHITIKSAILGSLAAKFSGNKNVVNAISGFGYNFTDERDGLLQKIMKLVLKFAFRDKHFSYILQNPDDINAIKEFNFTSEDKVYLIKGSGIDLQQYSFAALPNNEKLNILFPARILRDKGIIELIDAAKLLQNKLYGKVTFILAGDCDINNPTGIHQDELNNIIVKNYIEWVGYQKQMYEIYKSADIVILPSYREGLPKSLIEACAVGRPIITTDVPGCRECVIENYNGILVKSKNVEELSSAIEILINNKDLRVQYGKNARLLAEKEFSIESVIDKHFSIYKSIN